MMAIYRTLIMKFIDTDMIREEEPMEDLKINLKQKSKNNYDDDDNIKPRNFIFNGNIVNIQIIVDEININRLDEDIEIIKIQPSHPRDRHATIELRLTKIQPSHPRDRMARRSKIPVKKRIRRFSFN